MARRQPLELVIGVRVPAPQKRLVLSAQAGAVSRTPARQERHHSALDVARLPPAPAPCARTPAAAPRSRTGRGSRSGSSAIVTKLAVSTSGCAASGTGGSSTIDRARSRAQAVTWRRSPSSIAVPVVVEVGQRARHVGLAQPEEAPDHPVVLPVGRLLLARESPDVAAVDHEARVHEREQHPQQQLGVVGPVGRCPAG